MKPKKLQVFLTLLTIAAFLLPDTSFAKRGQRWRGRSGKHCVGFARPPLCPVAKRKVNIYVQPNVCSTLKSNPSCLYTVGYRSCRENGGLRGAATRSAHLCGKAADIRDGSCGFGKKHNIGSAPHRHYQVGSCF
jgi:hypothetical protein